MKTKLLARIAHLNYTNDYSLKIALYFYQFFSIMSIAIVTSSLYLNLHNDLNLSSGLAIKIIGTYMSISYTIELLAGYLNNSFLSHRYALILATILQMVGCYYLSLGSMYMFYLGAAFALLGGGLSITTYNIICNRLAVNQCDRKSIFIKNILMLSIAIFVGEFFIGLFQHDRNYDRLYQLGYICLIVCLVSILSHFKQLKFSGKLTKRSINNSFKSMAVFGFLVLGVYLSQYALKHGLNFAPVLFLFFFLTLFLIRPKDSYSSQNRIVSKKYHLFLLLVMAIVFIQTIEFIQPTLMMDFLNTSVNNVVDHYHIPTAWIDNIRGVLCIATLLVLTFTQSNTLFWVKFSQARRQIMLACILFICAFATLIVGLLLSSYVKHSVNILWAVGFESFCGFAEVILSIQCYLIVGGLIVKRYQSKAMGIACCIYGISSWFSYRISSAFFHKQSVLHMKIYDHNIMDLCLFMIISLGAIFLILKYPYFAKFKQSLKIDFYNQA